MLIHWSLAMFHTFYWFPTTQSQARLKAATSDSNVMSLIRRVTFLRPLFGFDRLPWAYYEKTLDRAMLTYGEEEKRHAYFALHDHQTSAEEVVKLDATFSVIAQCLRVLPHLDAIAFDGTAPTQELADSSLHYGYTDVAAPRCEEVIRMYGDTLMPLDHRRLPEAFDETHAFARKIWNALSGQDFRPKELSIGHGLRRSDLYGKNWLPLDLTDLRRLSMTVSNTIEPEGDHWFIKRSGKSLPSAPLRELLLGGEAWTYFIYDAAQ